MNVLRVAIAMCAGLMSAALCGCQTLAPERSPITDLTQKLHLTRVGDVVTDGHGVFVCVEDTKQSAYLLNVATYRPARALPAWDEAGCAGRLPSDLKRLNASVQYRPTPGLFYNPVNTDASFAGGQLFLRNAGLTRNCGPNLPFYYTAFYPTGRSYSFYLIVRLKRPIQPPISRYCVDTALPGRARTYQFYFADEGFLQAIDAGKGTTLLIDGNSNSVEPVLLAVRSLPPGVWSTQQDIFIVPRDSLEPLLQQAAGDPAKRFEALMSLIGQSAGYTVSDQ